jgi:hypothetical protein
VVVVVVVVGGTVVVVVVVVGGTVVVVVVVVGGTVVVVVVVVGGTVVVVVVGGLVVVVVGGTVVVVVDEVVVGSVGEGTRFLLARSSPVPAVVGVGAVVEDGSESNPSPAPTTWIPSGPIPSCCPRTSGVGPSGSSPPAEMAQMPPSSIRMTTVARARRFTESA